MKTVFFTNGAAQLVGMIPAFLHESDPRSAAVQFNENYAHGGGWSPMEGWSWEKVRKIGQGTVLDIRYPDDPPYSPIAMIQLRAETIWVYEHAWVAIESEDGTVEISRMD